MWYISKDIEDGRKAEINRRRKEFVMDIAQKHGTSFFRENSDRKNNYFCHRITSKKIEFQN